MTLSSRLTVTCGALGLFVAAFAAAAAGGGPSPGHPPALGPPAAPTRVPAALTVHETLRYAVRYAGSDIGDATLTVSGRSWARPGDTIHFAARAQGALMALGRFACNIDGDYDFVPATTRRWTSTVSHGSQVDRDAVDQPQPGRLTLESAGASPRRLETFMRGPVLDAAGFLLELRARLREPVSGPFVLRVLTERLLWKVTVRSVSRVALNEEHWSGPAIRLDARAEPIFYDGAPSRDGRSAHQLAIWITDDERRVPVRLEIPVQLGTITLRLVDVSRTHAP